MGKKISLGIAIALVIISIAVTYAISTATSLNRFNSKVSSITEREKMYSKFTEVDNYVRQYYTIVDEENLMDSVAKGYLSGINDPYAKYMDPESLLQYIQDQEDVSNGIGVSVTQDSSGYMLVEKVFSGSTAETAGIQKDDLIVKIDNNKISSDNFEKSKSLLTGEAGTKVSLTIRRNNEDSTMEITRRAVTEECISYSKVGEFGYIHIDSFNSSAPEQFSKIIETAIAEGSKSVILDVRNTSEGSYKYASNILDQLLGTCDLLSINYLSGESELLYKSNAGKLEIPTILIMNESTSGPAEFFAGCLRDYGKAKIVGTKSKGYGPFQEIFKLDDGSAIQLTTGKYALSATGFCWDQIGISPDYLVQTTYTVDFSNIQVVDTEMDTQLSKAVELIATN